MSNAMAQFAMSFGTALSPMCLLFSRNALRTLRIALTAITLLIVGCDSVIDDGDDDGNDAREVDLGIADRYWDPGHDDVGWCGETCIQMALGYYGSDVEQADINEAAGSPTDIGEASEMDAALTAFNAIVVKWTDNDYDVSGLIEWIKDELRAGYPVICGVKIYPDEHPDWYVDHFVLAVGFDDEGLLMNTQLDCDGQIIVSYDDLTSTNDDAYSFVNDDHLLFARSVRGVSE